MEEEKSIKELLRELNDKFEDPKVTKKFRLPLKARVGNRAARKGWTTVMKIGDNRQVTFEKQPIDEQTIVVDGVPRIATSEEILIYKNKPLVIQPSWTTKPFSPTDNYSNAMAQGYASQGYKLLLNRMKYEQIKPKRTISGIVVFGIIIAIIAAGYLAYQGGWLG